MRTEELVRVGGSLNLSAATLTRTANVQQCVVATAVRLGLGIGDDPALGNVQGHDGSNLNWYCSVAVYPPKGFALLAVTNAESGAPVAGEVISMLRKHIGY